jgi:polyhydroxyalkanoate synthesis regulator phasin
METIIKNERTKLNQVKSKKNEYLNSLKEDLKEIRSKLGFNKVSDVFQSNNYDLFQFYGANRDINTHQKQIRESISVYGNLTIGLVAEVNNKFYILDGQHRFISCRELGIPFEFKLIKLENNDDIVRVISALNSNAKKWQVNDYLNAWVKENKKSYIKLQELSNKYKKVSLSVLLQMVFNIKKESFELGLWTCTTDEFNKGKKLTKQINDIIPHMYENGKINAQPMRTLVRVMLLENYNHKIMLSKIKANKGNWSADEKELKIQLLQEISYSI